jgi:hypothetical protein
MCTEGGDHMKKQLIVGALVISLTGFSGTLATQAFDLGSVLKIGGVGVVVSKFGEQLNDFLNKLLMKNGVGTNYATKVVPVISVGGGGYVGAAQVVGPAEQVEQVKAVGQIEAGFNGNLFRAKALIPIDAESITNMHRIQGVGVSAMIDVRF